MTTPISDSHAIPPNDEPGRDYSAFMELEPMLAEVFVDGTGRRYFTVGLGDELILIDREFVYNDPDVVIYQVGPLTRAYPVAAPAKTHDLSVRKSDGDNLVITVENEKDDIRVYIPTGFAKDLGLALAHLTSGQIALLIGELAGGER